MTAAEREQLREKKLRIKDKYENNNLGDFQNLYPLWRGVRVEDDAMMDRYDKIYQKAYEVYLDSTSGTKSYPHRNKKDIPVDTGLQIDN